MRKLLEMCFGGLGLLVGLFVVFGLFMAAGLLCLLVWAGESVAGLRDGEPPAGYRMKYLGYVATRRFYRCPNYKSEWERFVGYVRGDEILLGLGWNDRLSVDTGPAKCQLCSRPGSPERKATNMKILHGELAVFGEEPMDSER